MRNLKILLVICLVWSAISCTAKQKKDSSMHQLRNIVVRVEQNANTMFTEE